MTTAIMVIIYKQRSSSAGEKETFVGRKYPFCGIYFFISVFCSIAV
jgi:hypothetical protein